MTESRPALTTSDSCPEKTRLADLIRNLMDEILELNTRRSAAVIRGDPIVSESIESQLSRTRTRKDKILEAYRNHVENHSC